MAGGGGDAGEGIARGVENALEAGLSLVGTFV
jgi:hypothetical protein